MPLYKELQSGYNKIYCFAIVWHLNVSLFNSSKFNLKVVGRCDLAGVSNTAWDGQMIAVILMRNMQLQSTLSLADTDGTRSFVH